MRIINQLTAIVMQNGKANSPQPPLEPINILAGEKLSEPIHESLSCESNAI
jgi:hypothetical protein